MTFKMFEQSPRRLSKWLIGGLIGAIFTFTYLWPIHEIQYSDLNQISIVKRIRNFRLLDDIQSASSQPNQDNNNIFFIESNDNKNGTLSLNPRQACSIESAGDEEPDKMTVHILLLFLFT